ncbi:hypothetical protein BH23BAC2_BH23BAC2_03250 [soil metagenome]
MGRSIAPSIVFFLIFLLGTLGIIFTVNDTLNKKSYVEHQHLTPQSGNTNLLFYNN